MGNCSHVLHLRTWRLSPCLRSNLPRNQRKKHLEIVTVTSICRHYLSELNGTQPYKQAGHAALRKLQSLDSSQRGPGDDRRSSKRSATEDLSQDDHERSVKCPRIDSGGDADSPKDSPLESLYDTTELPQNVRV
ncbi:hypothetical protein L914_05561 [Phytophthora nicotianae]|uniref:Uncharacterized protein n=1 Tax=Phytophthora nicotianae TaxID=4792 RepID=W2NR28_PHYNI|nr:hypothetical protein L914_05561 [Phytophthora nicotianae]